jgi:hypothetical protein
VTTLINQQLAPASFNDQGFGWQNLTTMKPNAQGEIKISLTDQQANGYVLADAARLVRMFGPEIEVIENQTMVVSGSSRIDYGQVLVNASPSRTFTIRNIGADVLTLGTPIVPSGFAIVGSAPTTIAAGSEASLTLAVVSSATAASRSGDLTLPSNDADESSFRISVAANIVSSMVIDDGDVGYTSTSGFGLFGGQGFGNDVRAEFSPNGGDTANWTFRGIPAGTLLRVGATWSVYSNRASNAQFSIRSTEGTGKVDSILVDQRYSPSDSRAVKTVGTSITANGGSFADLAPIYTHTGGDLVVTLSDQNANGWIIADAIRIAAPAALLAEAAPVVNDAATTELQRTPMLGPDASLVLKQAELKPVVDAAVAYWTLREVHAADRLRNVNVIVANLPAGVLGLGELDHPTIWLDDNAAGHGWSQPWHVGVGTPGIDLFTVITHELGHVLGLGDLDADLHRDDIMAGRLAAGEQRVAWPNRMPALDAEVGKLHVDVLDELFGNDSLLGEEIADRVMKDEKGTDIGLFGKQAESDASRRFVERLQEIEEELWDRFFMDLSEDEQRHTGG